MAKSKGFRFSLKTKLLIILAGIIFISNGILGSITFKMSSRNMTRGVNSQLAASIDTLGKQILAVNEKSLFVLRVISDMDIIRDSSISLAEKQQHLTSIVKEMDSQYENLAYYDKDGNAITADGRILNFAAREYFTEAIAGRNYISDPAFSNVTNSVIQHISVPVYDKEKNIVGALVMVINGNTMHKVIVESAGGNRMHPSVYSRKTDWVIANESEETEEEFDDSTLDPTKGRGLALKHCLDGQTGQEVFIDDFTGEKTVSAYAPIPGTDWVIFATGPYDFFFGSLKIMRISFVAIVLITMLIAAIIALILIRILIKPIHAVTNSITEISEGNADLTQRLPRTFNDEIGDVVEGFNKFVAKLQQIVQNIMNGRDLLITADSELQQSSQDASASITEIIANIEGVNNNILQQADSVTETAGAVNEISANIQSLEQMIENQSAGITQASSAVEQMLGNINSVGSAIGKMVDSFNELEKNTVYGIQSQKAANDKVLEIEQQSKMLAEANLAIANIARQTNLLAMNAAIEAAHAGEAGKGFAVVADEIRNLSETSSAQSKSIGAELNKISATIKEVVDSSVETNTVFASVSESINQTNQIIEQIKGAMEEQQIGSKQIIDALSDMNNSTSEVRIASTEMTEGSKQILGEIQKLQDATDMIKNSVSEMTVGAKLINETGATLTVISGKVSDSIMKIDDEIKLFKV